MALFAPAVSHARWKRNSNPTIRRSVMLTTVATARRWLDGWRFRTLPGSARRAKIIAAATSVMAPSFAHSLRDFPRIGVAVWSVMQRATENGHNYNLRTNTP